MKSWMRLIVIFVMSGFAIVGAFSVNAETYMQTMLWQASVPDEETQVSLQSEISLSEKSVPNNIHSYDKALYLSLNSELMRSQLGINEYDSDNASSQEFQSKSIQTENHSDLIQISVPLPDGSIIDLNLVEDSLLPKNLAAKFPEIKTYRVKANERVFSGKIDMNQTGFHAMLQMKDGETIFIDPVDLVKSKYAIYHKHDQKMSSDRQHRCGVGGDSKLSMPNELSSKLSQSQTATVAARSSDSLINYTIAVATTGEYSAKFGGSVGGTLSAITTTINRVNQVLERDLGIHLNLAENNDLLINTNADTDFFTETKLFDLIFQNQEYIDSVIGSSNYDIGHLFTTSGGGLAAIGSACNIGNKAKGVSGTTSPRGDSFDLDFVAHEIGHQLGATHTFNSSQGACSGETRTARTAFEPGSGSSIMSYAGYCGLDNIQSNTDSMYHIGSIKQIEEYTKVGIGSRCGVVTNSDNIPPQVNAGKDYTIPARTPFELIGSAVDSDGDSLLFAWEQLDAGDTSTESDDKGNNALFRVHSPNSSKLRSFPPLENILNHQSAKGESLPIYQRVLTMGFVAQDSFNVAQSDVMNIQVARTGSRFALNYPRAQYTRGNTYPIYWNVANTDSEPVNCSSVNIWLSVDGGKNFNYPLAENVPNNGETVVTIPADSSISTQGRFKIKCSDNIFFALSYRDFFVTEFDDSVAIQYSNEDQPEASLKDLSLNSEPIVNSSDLTSSSDNGGSGGGLFGIYKLLFLLFLFKNLFRFSLKETKQ